jgi:hypothetical protein
MEAALTMGEEFATASSLAAGLFQEGSGQAGGPRVVGPPVLGEDEESGPIAAVVAGLHRLGHYWFVLRTGRRDPERGREAPAFGVVAGTL